MWEVISVGEPFRLSITLPRKPVPQDSTYIPVYANEDFTLRAEPVDGSGYIEFDIPAKKEVLVKLAVTDITPISSPNTRVSQKVAFQMIGNRARLSLPTQYLHGTVNVVSISGRRIGMMKLNSTTQNNLAIWNVSAGIYLLQAVSSEGKVFTQKLQHRGGDIRIESNFAQGSGISVVAATPMNRSRGASQTTYAITLIPKNSLFQTKKDTYITVGGTYDTLHSYYFVNPDDPKSVFGELMDSAIYEEMFPNRYGLGLGNYISTPVPEDTSQIQRLASDGDYDFFTYHSLLQAIDSISNISVDMYQREGHTYMERVVWKNKKTGAQTTFYTNSAYDDFPNATEFLRSHVDFADFAAKGDLAMRKQELAAFLGNISHETTGGGVDEKTKTWGLYWREETSWQNGGGGLGYTTGNNTYQASSGQSYHGRGPIQLSYPTNYGPFSEYIYGDKMVLLNNPGLVVPDKPEEAVLAFMSAIWFWMTPQGAKPSCHAVMVNEWKPTKRDIDAGRAASKFGMTTNIINGGVECGSSFLPANSTKRVGHYRYFEKIIDIIGEDKCDCKDMKNYNELP